MSRCRTLATALAAAALCAASLAALALAPQGPEPDARRTPLEGRAQRLATGPDERRCASFSILVYGGCVERAAGHREEVRTCRRAYHDNLSRCRAQIP